MATIITIKNTRGDSIADVSSKEILKDVISVALIGRGAESYIEDFNQNFVKLLENLANVTAPEDPLVGQMWFDTKANTLKVFDGVTWNGYNVEKIGGKTTQAIRDWVLGYIQLDDKFDKVGGTITGDIDVKGQFQLSGNITTSKNEVAKLGSYAKRFKTLYIRDKSIFLGDKGKYHITASSFIYKIESNDDDVSKIPPGVIIVNGTTGVAVVKKSDGVFDKSNAKFGQLVYDSNNAVKLGRRFSGFLGDRMVISCYGQFQYVQIPTPMNSRYFGNHRYTEYHFQASVSGGGRAVWRGGWSSGQQMEYTTFQTPSNGSHFGNCSEQKQGSVGVSDGIRGVFRQGINWNNWWWWWWGGNQANNDEYITISTPANSMYFGSNSWGNTMYNTGGMSDGVKGVSVKGYSWSWWGWWWWWGGYNNNNMSYVTIATPGNSIYFGEEVDGSNYWWWWWGGTFAKSSTSDGIRGFINAGHGSDHTIRIITIATPGNSRYFGSLERNQTWSTASSNGYKVALTNGWDAITSYSTTGTANSQYLGRVSTSAGHSGSSSGN